MSRGFAEDEGWYQPARHTKHRGSKLKELFERHNMSEGQKHELNESDIFRGASSSFDNPDERFDEICNDDFDNDSMDGHHMSIFDRNSDYIPTHHRTTSIHRNISRRQNTPARTIPRNLEERRKWISQAATLNRQPLLEHAQKILEYMQLDSELMRNDPEGELLRMEALRNMPQSLAVKRIIKRKLMASTSSNVKVLGFQKMLKYQISIWFSKVKNNIRNLSHLLELWYSSLKAIEGQFGSGVSTYFRFLRKLFILNFLLTIMCICFIVIPQIVFMVSKSGENVTVVENNKSFYAQDIFTGAGYLTNTVLYYGFYTTGSINGVYNMPEAYFYTMVSILLASVIVIGISMARSYRKSFIETMGGLQNVFAHKIFCGWDYSIAKEDASKLRSSAIHTELKELLSAHLVNYEKVPFVQKFFVGVLQVAGHLFALGLVGATGFMMWYLLERHRTIHVDDDTEEGTADVAILTAVIVNAVMMVFPIIFRFIASHESYKSPRTAIIITFLRTLLLEVVVVGILIVFWLTHSSNLICWENSLGQEIYRLILFDFFCSVAFLSLFEVARYCIHKKFQLVEAPEFDISGNTFSVVYNQTLFWLGLYFTPLLGVLIILKLFLTWYIRSWICLICCVPPKKSWRAAQAETLFLIITFLSSLMSLFIHGYIVLNVPISNFCGPFRDFTYMYDVFLNTITEWDTNNQFIAILNFIRKPGVIALVLITMSMAVYYLRAKSINQREFIDFFRQRLILAAQDKEFLLRHISKVSNGDWHGKVNLPRDSGINPSHLPPKSARLAEYGDVAGTSSDDLITSSTTSFPFSDVSTSEYIYP